jgi:type I restriction enzyme S subunit
MTPVLKREVPRGRIDCHPDSPSDWEKCPFGRVVEVNRSYPMERGREYPFLEMAAVKESFGGIVAYDTRPFESSLSRFTLNDTLFAKITPCAENGKVAFVDQPPAGYGCGSTEFIVLSPRAGFDPFFVYSLAISPAIHSRAVSRMEGSTGRLRVTEETFKKWMWVSVPPTLDEQLRIAAALKATDEYIRTLEEHLRKAERVKTALLQSLFVAGLPGANFATTESKIGLVPSHWDFQRLGKTFREPPFTGVSPESRPNPPGTPILNVSCVNDGLCTVDAVTYVDADEATIRDNSAEQGDFFVLRGNGNRDYVGTGGWLRRTPPENCIFSDKLIRLRFDKTRVVEGFYPYLWQSRAFQIRLQSKAQSSSGLWMLNKRDISREWVALPPKHEQTQMVEILDAASENRNALQDRLAAAHRVKKSLLQNLLTGKIRLKA